jgi:hypothetical protein
VGSGGRLYDAMIAISARELDKAGLQTLLRELAAATRQAQPDTEF